VGDLVATRSEDICHLCWHALVDEESNHAPLRGASAR
jgi:hypothetical protein